MTNAITHGIVPVDKPLGLTSFDVVARMRRVFNQKQVGHSGTLDPQATGVLIVLLGHATKLSDYLMIGEKRYTASVKLGIETATYDSEGEILADRDAAHITADHVREALPAFTGEIAQIPPMYSAIKRDGKKLYELAREGKSVDLTPRQVTIAALELIAFDHADHAHPVAVLDVRCSHGTYIRSLAHDLGKKLGVGASLCGLVRTENAGIALDQCVSLETLQASTDPHGFMRDPLSALGAYAHAVVSDDHLTRIRHGQRLPHSAITPDREFTHGQPLFAVNTRGELAAVLEYTPNAWQPIRVFA
jgi:tRNA pseudouridine55 synthase